MGHPPIISYEPGASHPAAGKAEATPIPGGLGFPPEVGEVVIDRGKLNQMSADQLHALLNAASTRPGTPVYDAIYSAVQAELARRDEEEKKKKKQEEECKKRLDCPKDTPK